MKLRTKYKPELVCSKDGLRPKLNSPSLETVNGKKRIVATDGRRLAVIPVEAFSEESGTVPIKALEFARKNKKTPKQDSISINLNGKIEFENGWTMPAPEQLGFPDVEHVIPKEDAKISLTLNAKILYDLARALGNEVITLNIIDALCAIRVTVPQDEAFGVIMPVRV